MFGTFWEDSYDTLMVLHHVASVFFCTIRISQSSGLFQQLHSRKWQASTFNGHSPWGDSEEKGGRYRLHSNLGHWWHAKNMLNKYVQLWDVGVITIVIAVFSDTHTHFIKAAILGDVTWRWPSTDRSAGWWTLDILLKIWIKPNLVGAIPTPLKNMSSSVGATIPNIWTQMFQTTNQKLFILWKIHSPSWVYWILYVYIMKIPLKKWTNFIIFKPHPGGLCRSPHFFRKLVAIEAMAHHVRWFAVENHLCFFRKHVEPPDFFVWSKTRFLADCGSSHEPIHWHTYL